MDCCQNAVADDQNLEETLLYLALEKDRQILMAKLSFHYFPLENIKDCLSLT